MTEEQKKALIEDLKPIASKLIELLDKHNIKNLDVWTTDFKYEAMAIYKDANGNFESSLIYVNEPQHCEELEEWE